MAYEDRGITIDSIRRNMKMRVLLAVAAGMVFLFAVSSQDLPAAETAPGERLHTVARAELHDAVLASSSEAAAARKSVQGFLERPEVRSQIERMGLQPAAVASRVALLGDSELLRLHAQVMAVDEQMQTSGILGWVIAVITIAAILAVLIILLDLYYGD